MDDPQDYRLTMVGQTFGRLVVLGCPSRDKHGTAFFPCRCECGASALVRGDHLRSGRTQSCSCLQRERLSVRNKVHGLRAHPLYYTWKGMKQRCYDSSHKHYQGYGGRGITVHPAWVDSLKAFIAYIEKELGPRPEGHTLDRINNDGNYEPGNLRWASAQQQADNRRSRMAV